MASNLDLRVWKYFSEEALSRLRPSCNQGSSAAGARGCSRQREQHVQRPRGEKSMVYLGSWMKLFVLGFLAGLCRCTHIFSEWSRYTTWVY